MPKLHLPLFLGVVMKSIIRLTLASLIFSLISTLSVSSCPGMDAGARLRYGLPLGDEKNSTNYGLGAEFFAAYKAWKYFQLGVILRYTMYNPVLPSYPMITYEESVASTDFYAFLDYFWYDEDDEEDCGFYPYGGIQLGKSYWHNSWSNTYNGITTSGSSSDNAFSYGLHIGTEYKLTKSLRLDLKLDYTTYKFNPSGSFFDVNLGFRYVF